MKSGNFGKFINCSTNSLIGIVPYRYTGIQPIGNVSTITYNITFSEKWVDFEKNKINYHNNIISICKNLDYATVVIMEKPNQHFITRKCTFFQKSSFIWRKCSKNKPAEVKNVRFWSEFCWNCGKWCKKGIFWSKILFYDIFILKLIITKLNMVTWHHDITILKQKHAFTYPPWSIRLF